MHLLDAKGLSFTQNVFIYLLLSTIDLSLGAAYEGRIACYVLKILVSASPRQTAFCGSVDSFFTSFESRESKTVTPKETDAFVKQVLCYTYFLCPE